MSDDPNNKAPNEPEPAPPSGASTQASVLSAERLAERKATRQRTIQEMLTDFRGGRKTDEPVARLATAIEILVEKYENDQDLLIRELQSLLAKSSSSPQTDASPGNASGPAANGRLEQLDKMVNDYQALGAALAESSRHTAMLTNDILLALKRGEHLLGEMDKKMAESRQVVEVANATIAGAKRDLQNEAARIRQQLLARLNLLPLLVVIGMLTLGLAIGRACAPAGASERPSSSPVRP